MSMSKRAVALACLIVLAGAGPGASPARAGTGSARPRRRRDAGSVTVAAHGDARNREIMFCIEGHVMRSTMPRSISRAAAPSRFGSASDVADGGCSRGKSLSGHNHAVESAEVTYDRRSWPAAPRTCSCSCASDLLVRVEDAAEAPRGAARRRAPMQVDAAATARSRRGRCRARPRPDGASPAISRWRRRAPARRARGRRSRNRCRGRRRRSRRRLARRAGSGATPSSCPSPRGCGHCTRRSAPRR